MTELALKLPDDLAQRAKSAGLLSDSAIQRLLEDAMRRTAGRKLLEIAERVHAAGIPPMTDEEVVAEVKAARAEQRARPSKP
ncbi:MAG: hypothetical protein Q8O25_13570 [Sulfurisoma sp.]|nr:hypothetical protein [Sulfurisoma sp.]